MVIKPRRRCTLLRDSFFVTRISSSQSRLPVGLTAEKQEAQRPRCCSHFASSAECRFDCVLRVENVTFPVLVCLLSSFFWTLTISWLSIQCL